MVILMSEFFKSQSAGFASGSNFSIREFCHKNSFRQSSEVASRVTFMQGEGHGG